ncbi:hypothetical protein FQN60_010485 [Etheostoma spectabile]|uniref:Centrosome and spindle pole-associated protein 1 n=1 Tax=Etheostoma spectabile TaxID=54343 RepID=A0A5J5D864_9PERO|nr:hypothetical protein FQN60_010485 [Etheostoma spectabile]
MELDEELENFIRERKARMAEDIASLEQDPPYMEIRAKPHRAYGSTIKENIPPKEESCAVGLPLGVEYERKKQRLQHELRMDYRRYTAQARDFPKQCPPSRRDAATLTEECRGLHRASRHAEVKTLRPEEDEEQSTVLHRHWDRLGKLMDQDSEEEELELMEGRRPRLIAAEANSENRPSNRTSGREKRDNPVGRGLIALARNEDAEFSTGLLIGTADTADALRRRKERYRQELQEQIAEQHRNKKREKDLGLKVAATGANDPEKQPSATGESETSSRGFHNNVNTVVRDRETPPPEQPHVAFQSPLLEYSSALSLGGGGVIPMFPPHPPSTLSETNRNPYGEPHHYYGTRNLLDPNVAYYGHLSVPGAGLPVSYWNVSPGGALPSQFGDHSPHSQHSGSSFPEPPAQPSNEAAAVDSQVRVFPSDGSRSTQDRILSYRESLKQQIQEQQERRRLERDERERHEARLEADMKKHQPWGRGGGGAPLRDTDLNQMHKVNEEAYINPEQWQRRATAARSARQAELPDSNDRLSVSGTVAECSSHDTSDRLSGVTHAQTPQFARGNVFSNQPSQQQLHEQDKYKAYLKQQIEEKMRKKAEEREQTRLEEEKEEKRLAEQRARIQREYDEEQERKKRKEMEQKAKNEELIKLAEQRKKEVEREKKEAEEKERRAAVRREYERERQARVEEICREPSPPIPALQRKHGLHQYTPRPPTVDSQHSTAPLSERSLSGLQSPPVPACRNQLRAAGDQHKVFSELSALRRQLRSEQKRLEGRLLQSDWEELDRHHERPLVDVFDMARLRLQAPVRRPNSRNMEPRNLMQNPDSLQLKHTDSESELGFSEVPKREEVGVANRRRRDHRDPYHQFSSQRSTIQDDYFDLSPLQQNDYVRSVLGSARGSLLDSESAFIGEAFPVPRTPELEKAPLLSARERRRLAKQPRHPQDAAASSQPSGQHEDCSLHMGYSRHQEAEPSGEGENRYRTDRLRALSRHGNTAGPVDLSDDSSSPPRFPLHNLNHRSSVERVSTDPWTRPGTSDTLKGLDRPSRRQRLVT